MILSKVTTNLLSKVLSYFRTLYESTFVLVYFCISVRVRVHVRVLRSNDIVPSNEGT